MIDPTFRRESARLTAGLVRAFGPAHLSLAEDVVQEAFVRGMQEWSLRGVPPAPSAWLARVARNLAIDRLRREKIYAGEERLELAVAHPDETQMFDDELAMLLMCAHPALSEESQIALTLKSVCGLGVGEIAKGLLSTESAIAQRLVRAKNRLREADVSFDIDGDLETRLATVLRVLYLLFNEGYLAAAGASLTNSDICDEAVLLVHRLSVTPATDRPEVHALLSLMLLHSSRLPSRVGQDGDLCLLEDQDRTLWDGSRISAGMTELARASVGDRLTPYHCEAAIAACHASAPTFAATDWQAVRHHYDDLIAINPSPIARLNRSVAVAMTGGDALPLLDDLESPLAGYYLLPATRARILEQQGSRTEAIMGYERALQLARNDAERAYLTRRLAALTGSR